MSVIDQLVAGHHRFRDGYYQENRERLVDLARQGQSPRVAVVACCDSRVDPAVITDSNPGDIFVIRNVANLIPPCEGKGTWHGTSAALQFAVCGLNVEHIIVLGHARCGGIRALLEGEQQGEEGNFIADWMSIAAAARDHALSRADLDDFEARILACEREAIGISLNNLMTFQWIRERVEAGELELHGWYYDMDTGILSRLDTQSRDFVAL
ncbi:MAG TPA: carbonic anhydrase [Gammaproteobacteria bacterium]|nr:carbonic anhydrase [Gammaproteobacteria bacterium]